MKMVKKAHIPNAIRAGSRSRIDYIVDYPMKARIEIEALRTASSNSNGGADEILPDITRQ